MAILTGYPTTAGSAFIAQPGTGLIDGGIYTYNPSNPFFGGAPTVDYWGMSQPSGGLAPSATATSTGVNPTETSYSLYGHTIPLSVLGVARIGGEIIAGPWVENGLASFIISFGVPADPSGTRDLREIAFDSQVVWNSTSGFLTEAFTYRFYGGTLTQAADTLESTHFGVEANAYRPQMLLAFSNLPLASQKFRKIPYVAAVIGDSAGDDVNFGEMFERLAYGPWVGWTSAQFETSGITDGVTGGGLIIAQDSQFLQLIQQFGRFYPKWDILQTDKLRVRDRGDTVSSDITLDKSSLTGSVIMSRAEPNSVPKILELSTIDPDSDYTIIPSRAQTPLAPVAVSTSVKTESAYLPVVMDAATRASIVTYTKYHEEVIRKKVTFTAMAYGLEIEPGDYVAIADLGSDFHDEIFRIIETLHGANLVVEATGESILNCQLGTDDPHLGNVVLLLNFDGVNGSTVMLDLSPAENGLGHVVGTGAVSTAQAKFGTGSIATSGGGVVFFPDTDWQISSANADQFTLECWVYYNSLATSSAYISCTANVGNIGWLFWGLNSGEIQFVASSNGSTNNIIVTSSGALLTTGVWYAVAIDKDATGKIRIYKNGVMVGSSTPVDSSIFHSSANLGIGETSVGTAILNGFIDEVRITKGYARYASDSGYTVTTSAFPSE